jgi:glycosyltransferase involved in cell wall biosynthesis
MKVLYVLNSSNFIGIGGMEYHLIDISNWMEANGVETALAIRKGTFAERTLLKDRPNVYALSWTGFSKLFSFFHVGKLILDFSPDIISINRERDIIRIFFIAKLISTFMKKKPKIIAFLQNSGWKRFFVLGKLDGVIFATEYMKNGFISKNRSAETKSTIIYCGITLPKIDLNEKIRIDRDRRIFKGKGFPLIGMVGEMRKNQTELIDVAYYLKKKIPNFIIALIGRGNDDEIVALQNKIDRFGLTNNFIFTGRIDRERIGDVFYDLDLSISTHRGEPFGIAHIESLASYTPVIAYNSGGLVEILEKGGGVLVDGGPEEMANVLYQVLTDHALRISLGKAGRVAVENYFSVETMGQQTIALYKNIIGHKS